MLTKITDIPAHVAGFIATGHIDKAEYDKIVVPELERIDKAHGHIHFLLILETAVKNFTLGAWLEDIWMGIKHFRGLKRVAIVTDEKAVETITDKFSFFMPGKAKGFRLSEAEAAKKWVAEEE